MPTRTPTLYTEFKHFAPDQPSWRSRFRHHGYSQLVAVQTQWLADQANTGRIGVRETAVRDLDGQIRSIVLNEATDNRNPDDQDLVGVAHGVTVDANRPGLRILRTWPRGAPATRPVGYIPRWRYLASMGQAPGTGGRCGRFPAPTVDRGRARVMSQHTGLSDQTWDTMPS